MLEEENKILKNELKNAKSEFESLNQRLFELK